MKDVSMKMTDTPVTIGSIWSVKGKEKQSRDRFITLSDIDYLGDMKTIRAIWYVFGEFTINDLKKCTKTRYCLGEEEFFKRNTFVVS
jgi:hypothetical protein